MKLILTLLAALPLLAPFMALHAGDMTSPQKPLALRASSHLFIDDSLIEQATGLTRTMHQPVRLAQPVIRKEEAWHERPLFFIKVAAMEPQKFRMWYNIFNTSPKVPRTAYAIAESTDGIEWQRPSLHLVEAGGSKQNNLFHVDYAPKGSLGLGLVDDGPNAAEPGRRFKLIYQKLAGNEPGGLAAAYSADGVRFEGWDDQPVLKGPGDIVDACWDPLKSRYLICYKLGANPKTDGYRGSTPNQKEGGRRLVGQSESRDFTHWSKPRRIIVPNPKEPGMWEFYGMVPQVRGDLYLGFLRILRDDLPANEGGPVKGIGWTELCTSRDGEHWVRHREPFLDRNPQPNTWDRAFAWVGDCVTVGQEEFIYYGGYAEGHKPGTRQIGLAKLRKNGFVSYDAGTSAGTLRTKVLSLTPRLAVNAQIKGEMHVRLLDESDKPVSGCDWADCEPIRGDSLAHAVCWQNPPSKTVRGRLEFRVRDGALFGFEVLP